MSAEPLKIIAGAPDRPLVVGDIEIPCYVLEDETRVLTQRGVFSAFGTRRGGHHRGGAELPRFVASKALESHITDTLKVALKNPILFAGPGGVAHGYPATLLPDICDVILAARAAGSLQERQLPIAQRCEVLIRGLAQVGIIALVDEATGYQELRAQRALAIILEKFIAKELQPWTKTFPFEFYTEIARLKEWPPLYSMKRPSVIGHYTNDIVYDRIAPGVFEELRRINPTLPTGRRKSRHHQWFTPDPGYVKLNQHLAAVTALMRAAPNWTAFQRGLQRAFPKLNENIPLALDS